ncbi:MAG: hypothetical protein NT001_00785, partial [Candidatus Woesearchaeota archaeon]|nr:hypothetical protein [Candidatus Woesearchaeota archaeon]
MKKSRSIMILLSLLIIMSVSSSVYALATVSGPLSNATGGDINSPASPSASTPTASAAAPAIPAPAQPKPEPPKYHVNDEKIIVAGNGNEIYVNTFTPNPDDKAVLYAVDPENHLYQQQSDKTWRPLSDDEAKALPWANPTNADGTPNPLFNKDLAAQLGENQKYNDWRNTFLEKMDVPWM